MGSNFTRIWMPGRIRNLEIKNRLCNSPAIPNYSKRTGELTQREHDFYVAKAKGGFGIVALSGTSVNGKTARGFLCQPGLYNEDFIGPYKKLTDEIHKYGAKCYVQVYHPGRATHSMITGVEASEASTPVPCPFYVQYPGYKVEEMSTQRIKEVIQEFADTSYNSKQAGFDFVEINGGHGYLPASFLSPYFGKRTIDDGYGPPYTENNFKFHRELLQAIREKCGDDFPVGMRISADEFKEEGLTIEDGKAIAKAFEEIGYDYIGVSAGVCYTTDNAHLHMIIPSAYLPPLSLEPLAAALRDVTSLPLMVYGRVNSPEMAEDLLNRGNCDFAQMNRASWVDPELPNKTAEGREEEIRHCIYCNNGCIDRLWAGLDVTCTMNPELGMERLFDKKLNEPLIKKKKVLIIGGGPGGMSCARYARLRGHNVILCEKESELGGLNRYAQKGEGRGEWEEVTHYYSREIKRLGVDIRLGEMIDLEKVKGISPDAVVVATGTTPKIPIIKGVKQASGQLETNVVTVLDVLGDEKEIGNSVVIVGGNHFGIQAAFYLLGQGRKVTIVESMPELNQDLDGITWLAYLMPKLKDSEINVLTGTYVMEITPEGVLCGTSGRSVNTLDIGPNVSIDSETMIPCDTVVVGTGREPMRNIYQELVGIVPEVYEIGDCVKPRWTYSAIGEGAQVGIHL